MGKISRLSYSLNRNSLADKDKKKQAESVLAEAGNRAREIFSLVVDAYVETGAPVGSRTLSRKLGMKLSPATIRNVMADLESSGLLMAPHSSAGRMPTETGLRLFVDGLLEVGEISEEECVQIEAQCAADGRSLDVVLNDAVTMLSGLSQCAGLVTAPRCDAPFKHIEFISLAPDRALVVIMDERGSVENRIITVPRGLPPWRLAEAGRFLSERLLGREIEDARDDILAEIGDERKELDTLTSKLVKAGLAVWGGGTGGGNLIVHGHHVLLEDVTAVEELSNIRALFEALERKEIILRLLEAVHEAEGVRIFIGSDDNLFHLTGCSLVIAPYINRRGSIVGAIGVIGPTRINYARIIPMVDYTAKMIGRLVG